MIYITDNNGFSYYDTILIMEIIKLGDTYNIITNNGDIFISEEYSKFINPNTIIYKNNNVSMYIEKDVVD